MMEGPIFQSADTTDRYARRAGANCGRGERVHRYKKPQAERRLGLLSCLRQTRLLGWRQFGGWGTAQLNLA
jgi:hypothetical protein